nr:ATP-binding protein [Motilibacter aurantiacus]
MRAARVARQAVADTLEQWGVGDRVDEALLAVSEVAGNAARHGRPPIDLHLSLADGRVTISVADHDAACVGPPPPEAALADEGAESGRGLALVDAVADEWGCCTRQGRKQVWFALSTSAP